MLKDILRDYLDTFAEKPYETIGAYPAADAEITTDPFDEFINRPHCTVIIQPKLKKCRI